MAYEDREHNRRLQAAIARLIATVFKAIPNWDYRLSYLDPERRHLAVPDSATAKRSLPHNRDRRG
jgi:hypothetical protein